MGAATDSARAIFLPVLVFVLFQGIDCQQQQLYAFNGTASCSDAYKFPNGSTMGKSIQILLANLLRDAPSTGYKESNQGSIGDTVYGLLQCRDDLSQQECKSCAQSAATVLNDTCVRNSTKGGRVFLGPCFLRYEDHFFASTLDTVSNQVNCSTAAKTATFDSNLALALSFIKNKVPTSPKKFTAAVGGAASRSPAYVLGQCTPSLSSLDCASCLDQAQTVLATTCGSNDGGICLYPTCTLQFQNSKFFEGIAENATTTGGGKSSSRIALAIALPVDVIGLLLVSALGLWCVWKKRRKQLKPAPTGELDELHATLNRGPVTFSYELLRHATDDFGDVHKLGEGGFGAVYKGTFADGTELAIKKLSVVSKQGEIQFLNEVKTISNVQHRNLVKLLGCCVQGTERLLVYEFLKNNSLEKALFDEKSGLQLSWETRYNILLGTARGLTYLHEDSQVRIIHRDIKPSNILLDEFFEAKISDFGLARLHGEDEASEVITTKVAGTYGYMAPEYAFHGHLSEKADVFSFGILMLETVSGRKIRDISLPGEEQYLLEWAWQLHGNGMLLDLLDPKLIQGHSEPEKSLAEAVHIALMCTQGSAQARPTMSHVVAMLSGHSNVQVPHTTSSFDFGALKPMSFSHGGTSSSAASSDSKQKRNLSESFSSRPEPR